MPFENIDQIKKEFNFTEDDPKEIRKKLRRLMVRWHPDKHGGESGISPKTRDKFLKANEADQFLENYISKQTAIVPTSETTELIKLVRDLVITNKKDNETTNSEVRLSEHIDHGVNQLGKQYLAPKITVSAITTALTFLWLLPDTINEHSVLSNYINVTNQDFFKVWAMSLVLTIIVLYGTSISEDRQKRFQSGLKTELFQNNVFEEFRHLHPVEEFTKSDFVKFLTLRNLRSAYHNLPRVAFEPLILQMIGRPRLIIDPESAQIIADIVFERAERRGVIQKCDSARKLEDVYSFSSQ